MLEKVNAYFKGLRHLPKMLKFSKNIRFVPGFCCITISDNQFCIAYLTTLNDKPELQFCDSFIFEDPDSLKIQLAELVERRHLEGVRCSWVLCENNYQFLSMEALPVTASEFQTAIRWKITDSINFSIDDAVVDSFPLPDQKVGDATKMIAVIVARQSYLNMHVKLIREAGLNLITIDIAELALRNITALFEKDEKSSALIYLQDHHVDLIITQKQQLFFSRRLDFELNRIDPQLERQEVKQQLGRLALDIQRSFDYYQTQWRNPTPGRVFIATARYSPETIANHLSEDLSISLEALDIRKVINCKNELQTDEQGKFLLSIGGVLREVAEYADTTN